MVQSGAHVLVVVVLLAGASIAKGVPVRADGDSAMLQMLDAMQQLMTGESQYDREFYSELRSCMDTFDPILTTSQDAAWQGIIDYWLAGGGVNDSWGGYDTIYMEQNATNTDFLNMTIYEPCNYASNIATYHVPTEICKRQNLGSPFSFPDEYVNALGVAFSSLAMGSSFMHGSHTWLGHQQDNYPIGVIAYLVHQASLLPIEGASTVLTDLSYEPRNMTSLQIAHEFKNMYMNVPVDEWYGHTKHIDMPDYYLSFAGAVTTVLTLAFKPDRVDQIIANLSESFALPQPFLDFINDDYLPEIRNATSGVNLGIIEETRLVENILGTVSKLVYAFLWQEQRLTDNPMFLEPEVNEKGWEMLPVLNAKANALNTFDYFELDFQNGTDTYPGDVWCNPVGPHAKWHLESAIGLLDYVYLGDEMHRILTEHL